MLLFLIFLVTQEFEAELGNEALIEELQELERNPIQVNIAKEEDFLKIYWISPELAASIIRTREKMGGFKEMDDLRKVPGMSDEIFDKIKPYIIIEKIYESPIQFEIRTRFQETFPHEPGNLLGDPRKAYERLKVGYRNVSGVLLVEKDAYEADYTDLVTYGMMIGLSDRFSKVVLGDYKLEFGEGLLFGFPPSVTFKNQGVIKGRERGVRLYTNTGENTFLRGGCLESRITGDIRNFTFFSDTKLAGKVENGEVSIYYDYEGDHSTESGLAKKDRVRETLFGTRFEYRGSVKLGFTGYKNSHFLNPEGDKLGTHNLLGIDFSLGSDGGEATWGVPTLFGELGRCDETWAWVMGAEYKAKKLKLGTLYRYYPSRFYIFHSAPWSDRSGTIGGLAEKGNYLYGGYKIGKNTKISCYFDGFTWLPRIYSTDLPVRGVEYFCEIEHPFTRHLSIAGRYSCNSKGDAESKRFRLQADIRLKDIDMRMRWEGVYETEIVEAYLGELLYGDVNFKVGASRRPAPTISMRLILFDSELSKFGLYEYERDLPGVMRNQFVGGEGARLYLMLTDWIASFCRVSLKYEITSKVNESPTQKYSIQLDLER